MSLLWNFLGIRTEPFPFAFSQFLLLLQFLLKKFLLYFTRGPALTFKSKEKLQEVVCDQRHTNSLISSYGFLSTIVRTLKIVRIQIYLEEFSFMVEQSWETENCCPREQNISQLQKFYSKQICTFDTHMFWMGKYWLSRWDESSLTCYIVFQGLGLLWLWLRIMYSSPSPTEEWVVSHPCLQNI